MTILPTLVIILGVADVVRAQDSIGVSYPGPTWVDGDYSIRPEILTSPATSGIGWEDSFQLASEFVSNLTEAEKVQLITGTSGPCVGNIGPISRLGFSGLCLQDGPLAIRQADYASVFPAGLTVAASWDRKLARQRGRDLGEEFRGKGAHVILGPVAGPLGRSSRGGRNWEGFSADPYLTGVMFEESVSGVQERGVQVCGKHFVGNEQESQRYGPAKNKANVTIDAVSSNIDDQTMHEVYLWPFANAVKQGMASIMCSYNRLNSTYACQNSKALNGLLKDELGFQGWVVSDWGATTSSYQSANGGLDMTMPGWIYENGRGSSWFGSNATLTLRNGTLSIDRLNDMCLRIMTPYFHFKQQPSKHFPPIDGGSSDLNYIDPSIFNYTFKVGPSHIDVRDDHASHIRELGAAGIVLLKNLNKTLPLKKPKNIAVFGNAAGDITTGLYPEQDADIYHTGWDIGTLPVGGGSGTGRLSYIISPLEAIKTRAAAQKNNALVQYVLNNTVIISRDGFTVLYPLPPDVCLVFLKSWAREGYDRQSLLVDWNGTALVEKVASQCSNTVVVTNSAGPNLLPFANHPNVTAILAAHLGGQEQGNSIVDVLWGHINPSGKLPYTIPLREEDVAFSDITNSTELVESSDPNIWQSHFRERLLIDYRWFDFHNITPQYEFGYGLSYTTFNVTNLKIKRLTPKNDPIWPSPPPAKTIPGGNPNLWKPLYKITATIQNTGSVLGDAVPQLYLGLPQPTNGNPTPVKVLRGFQKVRLGDGQVKNVDFEVMRRDLSFWDVGSQQWTIAEGEVKVMVGFSSREIGITGVMNPLAVE